MLREFLKLGATCAALAVFFTPLEAARKITRERNVGALTPVPFGAIALNCSIWVLGLFGIFGMPRRRRTRLPPLLDIELAR
ncbi:sugar transmembrane transporter [Aureococcus anophagefferens]|nr:sugar transmembrane transporter [Aureococcus anophagefferens]